LQVRFFVITEILIATYNIRHGVNIAGELALDATASVLAQIDPQIISLQEVDCLRPRSDFVNQTAFLAQKLDMEYVFGASIRYHTGAYGNAILSKLPIISSTNHLLPSIMESRACLEVKIIIDNSILTVFNTHLSLNNQERSRQLNDIILPLVMKQKNPAVLCGDFNAPDSAEEIKSAAKQLQDTFKNNTGLIVNTYSAADPQVRIDYIFINSHCQCRSFYIVDSLASDHLPAVASISI